jgi:predicted PurR-regulated permease PerM
MIQRFFNYLIHNQILFALFIIAAGWIIIQIKDILLSVFISYTIMASILPSVTYLRKKKLPNILAVTLPFSTMLIAIFLLILPLIPFFTEQIQNLTLKFPLYLKQALLSLGLTPEASQVQSYLSNEINTISENAITVTTKVFGGIFSIMMIFIISFYLLLYYDGFKKLFARLFQKDKRAYIYSTLDKINDKLGAWLRGEIILMTFIGFLSWIALIGLGIPNALPLALFSGLLEIVPTLGPILSAIPAVIVALTISPTLAITVVIAYILIQLIENNFLVPKVMEKAVGLNPVFVILGVVVGANLLGFTGALLAIPLITFIIVIFKSLDQHKS